MDKIPLICLLFAFALLTAPGPAHAENPFTGRESEKKSSWTPAPGRSLLMTLSLWQQKLNQNISAKIRQAREDRSLSPILSLVVLAFAYGLLHAAGPGHGKAVAMSYIFSRNPGILTGLLFGILIAFFHGFSGAACVLGLHYVIQKSLTSTLGEVAHATQIISFSLITLLGIGMLVKNGLVMAAGHQSSQETGLSPQKDNKGTLIPWAMAVGLVPCPAVVMVVLCCLSMNQLGLGLLLAAFISLGMAATLSLVILSIIIAKQLPVNRLSGQKAQDFHTISGIVSGLAVTVLGSLFLMATLNS